MHELLSWFIILACLFVGCWVQTAMGFGMAVIAAPLLIMIKPELVPVLITSLALLLSVLNSYSLWNQIEWKKLYLAFAMRLPGTALGAWLLLQMDVQALQILIAICVLAAVLVSAIGKQFDYTPSRWGIAAFVSGVTGTTTSIGGPPMALVMQHGEPNSIRANLSIYFVYSCSMSLLSYAWIGRLDTTDALMAVYFSPACILGFWLGKYSRRHIGVERYRPYLLWLCAISGMIALYGAIY